MLEMRPAHCILLLGGGRGGGVSAASSLASDSPAVTVQKVAPAAENLLASQQNQTADAMSPLSCWTLPHPNLTPPPELDVVELVAPTT